MKNKFKTPLVCCENIMSFTCSTSAIEPILQLLNSMQTLGNIGSSRNIVVKWGDGKDESIFFDGDGSDRLGYISINGLTLKQWLKEWKRLKKIKKKINKENPEISNLTNVETETKTPL